MTHGDRLAPRRVDPMGCTARMKTARESESGLGMGFERLADERGFAFVYPDGYEGYWNGCNMVGDYSANKLNIDDGHRECASRRDGRRTSGPRTCEEQSSQNNRDLPHRSPKRHEASANPRFVRQHRTE